MRRPSKQILSVISMLLTVTVLAIITSRPPSMDAEKTSAERLAVVESQSASNNTSLVAVLGKMDALEARMSSSERTLASWSGRADIISWLMGALLATGAIQLVLNFKKQ